MLFPKECLTITYILNTYSSYWIAFKLNLFNVKLDMSRYNNHHFTLIRNI